MDKNQEEAYRGVMPPGTENRTTTTPTYAQSVEALEELLDTGLRYSVLISSAGRAGGIPGPTVDRLWPGTGVLVKSGRWTGVVTAAHNLAGRTGDRRWDSRAQQANLDIIGMRGRHQSDDAATPVLTLRERACSAYGVSNTEEHGPDLAYVPLKKQEVDRLDEGGTLAYNVDRLDRRPGGQKPGVGMILDGAVGVNLSASLLMERERGRSGVVLLSTQTIELSNERRRRHGWDYTSYSLVENEELGGMEGLNEDPEENERLKAVLREVSRYENQQDKWGGYSGAGLWSRFLVRDENGKVVQGAIELKGISFYAHEERRMIAHGQESIRRIVSEGQKAHEREIAQKDMK